MIYAAELFPRRLQRLQKLAWITFDFFEFLKQLTLKSVALMEPILFLFSVGRGQSQVSWDYQKCVTNAM